MTKLKLRFSGPSVRVHDGRSARTPTREDRRDVNGRAWYSTARWRRERLQHLKANPLCCYCEEAGLVVAATVVDHVVPHKGDPLLFWRRSNWASLCSRCHSSRKQREEREAGFHG